MLLVAGTLLAPAAGAQILDLGAGQRPALPQPTPYEELAEALARQNEAIAAREPASGSAELAIAIRLRLIDVLERDAIDHPERTLAAMTLASHISRLDNALESLGPTRLGPVRSALSITPQNTLESQAALDRWLRELLIEPALAAGVERVPGGWVPRESLIDPLPSYAGLREQLAAGLGEAWTPGVAARFDELADLGALAETLPGYRQSSLRLRHRLASALTITAAEGLSPAGELAEAIGAALDPERQDAAMATLDRLAALARLHRTLAALPRTPEVTEAFDLVRAQGLSIDPGRLVRAQRAADAAGTLLASLDEREIVRELRTLWRPMVRLVEVEAASAAGLVARAVDPNQPLADPALLLALRRAEDAARDLGRFDRLNGWLRDPAAARPVAQQRFRTVATRLIGVGRDLLDADKADAARAELSTLLELADAARGLEAASGATGTRFGEIAPQIARDWLENPEPADEPATAVRLAERLGVAIAEQAVLREAARSGFAIQSWPGFEMSPAVLSQVASSAELVVLGTIDQLAERRLGAVEARLAVYDSEHALARLVAALESGARARGLEPRHAGLVELLAGPPDRGAWLAAQRRDLAELCVLAECLPAAERSGQGALDDYLDRLALDILRSMQP